MTSLNGKSTVSLTGLRVVGFGEAKLCFCWFGDSTTTTRLLELSVRFRASHKAVPTATIRLSPLDSSRHVALFLMLIEVLRGQVSNCGHATSFPGFLIARLFPDFCSLFSRLRRSLLPSCPGRLFPPE